MATGRGPKRFLVTGGCGFIGSHLVDSLLADGHDVIVIDDLSTGKRENLDFRATLVVADVTDQAAVADAIEGVAGCFHLAAIASVTKSNQDWVGTHRVNQTGTVAVLNAARTAGNGGPVPVVYASSAAVYGDTSAEPITEDTPTRPITAYGADKLGSELHAAVAWSAHRVPTIGLRFFNVYGPRQDPSSPYSGVISIFAERLARGLPIAIYGDGAQVRDFIYVGDIVLALRAAMDRATAGAAIYNVCTGVPTTITRLAELIARQLGISPEIRFEPPRAGDIRRSIGSPDRADRALELPSRIALTDGLKVLLATK